MDPDLLGRCGIPRNILYTSHSSLSERKGIFSNLTLFQPFTAKRHLLLSDYAGVSKLVFLVAKLKPFVAKQNRASLARRAIINFSIPTALYQLAISLSNL